MEVRRRRRYEQLAVHQFVARCRQRTARDEIAHFSRGPAATRCGHGHNLLGDCGVAQVRTLHDVRQPRDRGIISFLSGALMKRSGYSAAWLVTLMLTSCTGAAGRAPSPTAQAAVAERRPIV